MKIPSLRALLVRLGIGNFNATMVIQSMFQSPAATDPKAPEILILVRHIQRALHAMGSKIRETGMLNAETANELGRLIGAGWLNMTWAQVVTAVVNARDSGVSLATARDPAEDGTTSTGTGGLGGLFDFLPEVPGGLLTYAVGGLVAYHLLSKKH